MRLVVNLIVNLPIEAGLRFLLDLELLSVMVDLLYSNDRDVVANVLFCFGFLIVRSRGIASEPLSLIDEQFDDVAMAQLSELAEDEDERVGSLAANLERLIDIQRGIG
jgi:hypothetical protein